MFKKNIEHEQVLAKTLFAYEENKKESSIEDDDVLYKKSELAKSSDVFFVHFLNTMLVLKRQKIVDNNIQKYKDQEKFLETLGGTIFPRLLTSGVIDNAIYTQIFSFIPGEHIYSQLNTQQIKNLFNTVKRFQEQTIGMNRFLQTNLYDEIATNRKNIVDNNFLLEIGNSLIESKWIGDSEQFPTHFDLHRSNIIFNGDEAFLVDIDAIILAPKEFQAAALFMSSFLLYEETKEFNLKILLKMWHKEMNIPKLYTLMIARAWLGACFFWKRLQDTERAPSADDNTLFEMYIEKIVFLQNYSIIKD